MKIELSDNDKYEVESIARKVDEGNLTKEEAKKLVDVILQPYKEKARKVAAEKPGGKKPCGCGKKKKKKKESFLSKVRYLFKGSVGLVKYARGKDRTASALIKNRQSICESCNIYDFGVCNKDKGGCGCVLYYKIRVGSESCPVGKWGPDKSIPDPPKKDKGDQE